jgi:hypothetical protein
MYSHSKIEGGSYPVLEMYFRKDKRGWGCVEKEYF